MKHLLAFLLFTFSINAHPPPPVEAKICTGWKKGNCVQFITKKEIFESLDRLDELITVWEMGRNPGKVWLKHVWKTRDLLKKLLQINTSIGVRK